MMIAPVRVEHHRLRRVVQRRIEIRDVVGLRVDRLLVLVAQPHLEAQVLLDAPGVRHVAAVLREAEEPERIVAAFGVGAEVAEQRVGERVAGRTRIAGRVEADVAGVLVAAVLVLAVARDDDARAQRMRALDPRQVVRERDVGRRRQQRPRGSDDLGRRAGAGERDAGNAVEVVAAAIEHLRELEPVGVALPVLARRRNPLAVPRRRRLHVVEQVRADDPGVRELDAVARANAVGRDRRHRGADERAARLDQVVLVVQVAQVEGAATRSAGSRRAAMSCRKSNGKSSWKVVLFAVGVSLYSAASPIIFS